MSQSAVILPGSPLSGSTMVGDINAEVAAIISKFSGATAPTLGPGTAGALVEGQWWLDTSVTPNVLRVYDAANWCPLLTIDATNHLAYAPGSYRNIIGDNGGLEVWQRGAGSSASIAVGASSTAYTADRWYLTTGANEASTVAAVTGLTNGSNLAGKVTKNSGQTGTTVMTFGFPLDTDEIASVRGAKVTISASVKAGANWSPASGTLNLNFYVGTGSVGKRGAGFTSETTVATATANIATSASATLSAVSAAVVPTNSTQGELQFTWTPTGTAGGDDSITIDDVQLEVGVFQSTFERVPFEMMMHGCRRHYYKTFLYGTAPATNVGANTGELQAIAGKAGALAIALFTRHPRTMRATPTVTTYNPSAANAQVRWESGATGDASATTTANRTTESVTVTATGNAGAAVGDTIGVHLEVDAGI